MRLTTPKGPKGPNGPNLATMRPAVDDPNQAMHIPGSGGVIGPCMSNFSPSFRWATAALLLWDRPHVLRT